MSRKTSDAQQRVLDDNRRMAATTATIQRKERQLVVTNKMLRSDIESLKKRLEQFCTENDDLLGKLAEMKRDKAQTKRQFDEQIKRVTDELRQLKDSHDKQPDNDQLQKTRQQLQQALQNIDELQQKLDSERCRYAELERINAESRSRLDAVQLQTTQSLPASKSDKSPIMQVQKVRWKQQLENQVHALTRELAEVRQRLANQVDTIGKFTQTIQRLKTEKTELEEKNHDLSLALDNLKRANAALEREKEMLHKQLDKLKQALEECSITEDVQKNQLQSLELNKCELEQLLKQMRAEQRSAKETEKMVRDELKKIKQAENERETKNTELKRKLAKAQEDYNNLSLKTQVDISRLTDESKGINEDVYRLKKANLHLTNSERQLKAELEETNREAENKRDKLQKKIDTLQVDLQASEEVCIKHRKERDEMLEKLVPKERLETAVTELKRQRKDTEKTERRIQNLQDDQNALQQKTHEKEQELNQEIERMRSELKTKNELLEKAAEESVELENKNEKLKQSVDEKEKLFNKEHDKLQQKMKEENNALQERIQAIETQHLVEKEHMLKISKEKEKELKNKMKEFEVRAETDQLKSKYAQLETTCTEKLRQKDLKTMSQIEKLRSEVKEQNKLAEKANEKNKELQNMIDEQISQTNELKTLQSANEALKEKVGKLERAVLRLRLDNEELREFKEHSINNELAGERKSNVTDFLPLQALEGRLKRSPRSTDVAFKTSQANQHGGLLEEMMQLLKTDSKQMVADSSTLARELEAERNKVRAGCDRIAQLERWLDTIFNDQQFGLGPSTVGGGNERTPRLRLPPVDGVSRVPTIGKPKLAPTTTRSSDRFASKQKLTRTFRR